jgi:hypothetical protein
MEKFDKIFETLSGNVVMKCAENGVITFKFEGTDAVLCVYAEDNEYKVAYMPLPDCDRTPDMCEKDIRFTIEKTNVAEYVASGNTNV